MDAYSECVWVMGVIFGQKNCVNFSPLFWVLWNVLLLPARRGNHRKRTPKSGSYQIEIMNSLRFWWYIEFMCYKMCAKLVSFLQMCRPPDLVTLTHSCLLLFLCVWWSLMVLILQFYQFSSLKVNETLCWYHSANVRIH